MKKLYILLVITLSLNSCVDLDLYPLSEGSSENWFSSESEMLKSVMGLYAAGLWSGDWESWTDDWTNRTVLNEIPNGSLNSASSTVSNYWDNCYKAITRANVILANEEKAYASGIKESSVKVFIGEAKFARAGQYARLVTHFGDVPLTTEILSLEEAFSMGRTDKQTIIAQIYKDFDEAIEVLPVAYQKGEPARATKGAALAMKARFALHISDWRTAADAASACIKLEQYELLDSFSECFLSSTKNSKESVFFLPRSVEYGVTVGDLLYQLPRNVGGYGNYVPSWELLDSFECTDGLSIDRSALYDPQNPFRNRDPRLAATIVEFGSVFLGVTYDPSPVATTVLNHKTGQMITNNDSRINNQYASYNGLLWKKGIDESWLENGYKADPDLVIIRYADVLLMYAEAKTELNEIDDSVLKAINRVRARAYGVSIEDTGLYPAITITGQTELRKRIRNERRVELAKEGIRYMDIIRWRIAEKVLTKSDYGLLDPQELIDKVVEPGLWVFPGTPSFDNDMIPYYDEMYDEGLIKLLSTRNFDKSRQYLWPIPYKELLINENMKQNPGY